MQILFDWDIFRSRTLSFHTWLLYLPDLKNLKKPMTLALSSAGTWWVRLAWLSFLHWLSEPQPSTICQIGLISSLYIKFFIQVNLYIEGKIQTILSLNLLNSVSYFIFNTKLCILYYCKTQTKLWRSVLVPCFSQKSHLVVFAWQWKLCRAKDISSKGHEGSFPYSSVLGFHVTLAAIMTE